MSQLSEAISEKDHIQGSIDSPVILVEYGDYQCSVCKMTLPIIKQLQKEIGEKMCFTFRHFPLKALHPHAFEAAKAAEAAALQNKFWEMHQLLFAHQYDLSHQIYSKLATELNLDSEKFNNDFSSSAIEEKVQNQFMAGVRSGVNGIPCFYINGKRFDGDASYNRIKEILTKEIDKSKIIDEN